MSSKGKNIKALMKSILKQLWLTWRIIRILWLIDRVLCLLERLLSDDG